MSLLRRNLRQVWDQLRAKKPQMPQFLESVQIRKLRGIESLQITFGYPVTVIAGPNGCGKSTVLFACACAYDVSDSRDYSPTVLFPNLKAPAISDHLGDASFEYFFVADGSRVGMTWRRGKSWTKNFMGRKAVHQPKRALYLRTLANLTSPSEVRSILQIGSKQFEQSDLDADLIAFAHRVLPFKYRGLKLLQLKGKDLLFADREDATATYSEFHMSAGERALLHISKDISRLKDAFILIDEIEAGLHPYTQQQVMLELQRLALRNNLQIIVTSHSPVVLESVPVEGRIFLERTPTDVTVQPPYRDIFQRAFYGQSQDKLSILCEDSIAEGLILGVLDTLNVKLNLNPDDVVVGRDTGKDQFPQHVETLGKFQLLDAFVLVLDGDARQIEPAIQQAAERFNQSAAPLFLPGIQPPEEWIYAALEKQSTLYSSLLAAPSLEQQLKNLRQSFDNASDKPTNIAKNRFETLADALQRDPEEIARMVGRTEAAGGEMKVFSEGLEQAIYNWRQRGQ
ncbi:AAA family ATPase [uncultured Thiodictyon sp.]|jgi:predicted ATPase|uniref:AAA family ATPase n=1 Tax=uncultured Thiodictyon sp. TaxID=1846217 RepID=UPI0025DE7D8D|nr:AAA family ATPase [uncultured Thiodictyon sp.]